jgi:hypothetical protein
MNIDPNDAHRWDHRSVLEMEQHMNRADGKIKVRPGGILNDVSNEQAKTNG